MIRHSNKSGELTPYRVPWVKCTAYLEKLKLNHRQKDLKSFFVREKYI